MPEPPDLRNALARLEQAFERARPAEADRLRPPLTATQVANLSTALVPYQLPADLALLYQWHDGFDDWRDETGYLTLLMDASFPSFESALAEREKLLRFASDDGDPSYWPPAWFPAFGTSQSGDFVTLEPRTSERSPVLWSYHSHDSALTATYDSVANLIVATAQLWEDGLLPWLTQDDPDHHRRRLEVVGRLNPYCFDGHADWAHRRIESSRALDRTWLPEWRDSIGWAPSTEPLPNAVPIAQLNAADDEPTVIAGRVRTLAGGADWRIVDVTDSTGTARVRLARAVTKNYIAVDMGEEHLLWIVPASPQQGATPRTEVAATAVARVAELTPEFVALELRPIEPAS